MPLAIYTSAAWTANGGLSPASQALVTVRSESTGGLAALFEDRDGNSGLDNPFNADSQGRFEFYVTGGAYRVEVESDGFTQELRHQAVGTAAEFDAGALSDHESPEDKQLLARLDHLESALGIDTEGPAGDDVLAAVGLGAVVDVIENSDGDAYRMENSIQVSITSLELDFSSIDSANRYSDPSGENRFDLPAPYVSDTAYAGSANLQFDSSLDARTASEFTGGLNTLPRDSETYHVVGTKTADDEGVLNLVFVGQWK